MRVAKVILGALIGLPIGLYSCNDDGMHNELSQEDLVALEGLREAYIGAFDANVALKEAVLQDDVDGIQLNDSVYHHFEGLFEEHHGNYSHANGHDDHHHDADGKHMGSNVMNSHDQTDGHHDDDHQVMEDLMDDHESITHG